VPQADIPSRIVDLYYYTVMCVALRYLINGAQAQVLFGPLSSKIPVLLRSGKVEFYEWGDEGNNTIRQPSLGPLKVWPQGGCATLESIKAGEWAHMKPKPCKVPASAFAIKDHEGKTRWFDVPKGHYLQGMHVAPWYEPKVYLVSVPATGDMATVASRWVRLVGAKGSSSIEL
jgi:hypothetical protein